VIGDWEGKGKGEKKKRGVKGKERRKNGFCSFSPRYSSTWYCNFFSFAASITSNMGNSNTPSHKTSHTLAIRGTPSKFRSSIVHEGLTIVETL